MREGVVEALAAGDRVAWPLVGVLWLVLAALALLHDARAGLVRSFALLALASAASVAGVPLVAALSIPRIGYEAAPGGDLALQQGETWRRLRGPAVHIAVGGVPDVALPTIDASGDWVLLGILAGQPIPGLPPAPQAAPEVGAPRLCSTANDKCRAWPTAWPDPSRSPVFAELTWHRDARGAVAYDVESRLFLRAPPEVDAGTHALELVGKVTNDAPRSSAGARLISEPPGPGGGRAELRDGSASLFVLRRIHGGRLDVVRLVANPGPTPLEQTYEVHRASVSLVAAPRVAAWIASPLLWVSLSALPIAVALLLAAPALLSARLRRSAAVRHESEGELSLAPVTAARGVAGPATVVAGCSVGGTELERGTTVQAQLGADDGSPARSRAWYVLGPAGAASPVYVPADPAPFARAARAWIARRVAALALGAAVAASIAPAIVAIASILSAR